jgi:hypothetical protein
MKVVFNGEKGGILWLISPYDSQEIDKCNEKINVSRGDSNHVPSEYKSTLPTFSASACHRQRTLFQANELMLSHWKQYPVDSVL